MLSRDYTDILGGLLLIITGVFFSSYAAGHYGMGTLRQMGPGMFPAGVGIVLAVFGAITLVPALFRRGERPEIGLRSPLFVLAAVAAFALVIHPFGLIPAILGLTIVSTLAELKVRPVSLVLLCVTLCTLAWLIFKVGLGLAIPLFRSPF